MRSYFTDGFLHESDDLDDEYDLDEWDIDDDVPVRGK